MSKEMTFEQFTEEVKENILDFLPEKYKGYSVETKKISKIGKGEVTGLMIKNPDSFFVPSLYLEGYYEEQQLTGRSVSMTLTKIAMDFHKAEQRASGINYFEDIRNLMNEFDWDHIKPLVYIEAVKTEGNEEFLANVPHTKIGDIAGIYRIFISENEEGRTSTVINHAMLDNLGISKTILHTKAVENAQKAYPITISSMISILEEMGATGLEDMLPIETPQFYVLTNKQRMDGASCIFYPEVQERIAEFFPNGCYILPSSVHEVLLIDSSPGMSVEEMTEMVTSINASQVAPDEQLSNQVYRFDAKTRTIGLANPDLQRAMEQAKAPSKSMAI